MDTLSSGRRSLIGLIVSLSAALACVGSLACSSNGSSFDMGGAGSTTGSTTNNTTNNTTNTMGGSGVTDPTNTMGGSGVVNPTQATGGTGQPVGGSSSTAGVSSGGAGTVGGDGAQGGVTTGGQPAGGMDSGPVCPKPAGQICHEFVANDNGRAQVNYINEFTSTNPGGVAWTKVVGHNLATPENSPRTIEIVDNPKAAGGKAILVSVNDGYVELDQTNGTILANVTVQFTGITGACRLPDGTTALGTNASIRIVSANGVQSRAFNLPAGSNLRAINRDPATGHFWLSKTETVYEVTDQGQIAWQGFMGAGTKGYAVWWRAGGGAYGTTGEPHTIVELDGTGKIVQTIGGNDPSFSGLKLDFFSGFVRTAKGTFIVAHWLGHNDAPDQNTPEVIEFEPDGKAGKVVWTWGNQTLARSITSVFVVR